MTVQEFRKTLLPKKVAKPKKYIESEIQQKCIQEFRLYYKPPQYFIFAIPNGGKAGGKLINGIPEEAIRLKREGLTAGVADLFVMTPFSNESKGLFAECKTKDGRQSEAQIDFEKICLEMGYNYAVFRSVGEFFDIIKDLFSDKKGKNI
jgi:hypothetical protein